MAGDRPSDSESRVVMFPRGRRSVRLRPTLPSPVNDLTKFAGSEGADDYRHRMKVNIAAFVFVLALIGAGLWLAESMAELRKNEDCLLSGRHGCAPVEINTRR